MLSCEGYKMAYGTATVTPKNPAIPPFKVKGTWLYKPDTAYWYCNGCSYAAAIVGEIIEE